MIHDSPPVLTFATGLRPKLLHATLQSLVSNQPVLVRSAHVIVLHNGLDPETGDVLRLFADCIDELLTCTELMTIGNANTWLSQRALESGREYWVSIEDDWESMGFERNWYEKSVDILNDNPLVSQVRLRLASEKVLDKHMVTGQRIDWQPRIGYKVTADAHRTHNPAVQRTQHAAHAYPAENEREMQRHWRGSGLKSVAQLEPGEFRHLGGGDASLKGRMRRLQH